MKALHEMTVNEQTLMPKDWLQRRLSRFIVHSGTPGGVFRPVVTLVDIAKWFNVDYSLIRHLEDGKRQITDTWQVQLSQFFYLLDMGLIEIRVHKRSKTWVRATPKEPPCKAPMPRVDFLATKLKFD